MTKSKTLKVTPIGAMDPESKAYSQARFSHSGTESSYENWAMECHDKGGKDFLEMVCPGDGHSPIVDLALGEFTVENVSMVAAIELFNHPLVNGRKRSTRDINFKDAGFHTPKEIIGTSLETPYTNLCADLFRAYEIILPQVVDYFSKRHKFEKPADMPDAKFEATCHARAMDVARYLLPLSTLTGVGIQCTARTLEGLLIGMLSSSIQELVDVAVAIKRAVTEEEPFSPVLRKIAPLLEYIPTDVRHKLLAELHKTHALFPTILRYATPSRYLQGFKRLLEISWMAGVRPGSRGGPLSSSDWSFQDIENNGVRLWHPSGVREDLDLSASALYPFTPLNWGDTVNAGSHGFVRGEIERVVFRSRGAHDDLPNHVSCQGGYIVEFCVDHGAFLDLHKHRWCVQLIKPAFGIWGWETPVVLRHIEACGVYTSLMERARDLVKRIYETMGMDGVSVVPYAQPLAFRRLAVFKADWRQLLYMIELRSKPHGHFSYRYLMRELYAALGGAKGSVSKYIVCAPDQKSDFYTR